MNESKKDVIFDWLPTVKTLKFEYIGTISHTNGYVSYQYAIVVDGKTMGSTTDPRTFCQRQDVFPNVSIGKMCRCHQCLVRASGKRLGTTCDCEACREVTAPLA